MFAFFVRQIEKFPLWLVAPRAEFSHISDTGIIGILMAAMPALADHHTNTHPYPFLLFFTAARWLFIQNQAVAFAL